MFNLKGKKNGFTLAETVIVCTVFAVMILGVIFAINRAYVFLNDTRLRVIATNFAREGVEMVYNIRDTNWREHPGDRDAHRLDTSRTGADTLSEGIYLLKERKTLSGDSYIYLTGLTISTNITEFYEIDGFFSENYSEHRERSKLAFTGMYSYNSGGSIVTGNSINELMDGFGATFYRIVRIYGIYKKNDNSQDASNKKAADSELKDSTPKELRFCVKVFYDANGGHHATELCSIMTNFME